jgi:hypothetical protein
LDAAPGRLSGSRCAGYVRLISFGAWKESDLDVEMSVFFEKC